jgi:hypothetical protein
MVRPRARGVKVQVEPEPPRTPPQQDPPKPDREEPQSVRERKLPDDDKRIERFPER